MRDSSAPPAFKDARAAPARLAADDADDFFSDTDPAIIEAHMSPMALSTAPLHEDNRAGTGNDEDGADDADWEKVPRAVASDAAPAAPRRWLW